jgi:hypothetical protein
MGLCDFEGSRIGSREYLVDAIVDSLDLPRLARGPVTVGGQADTGPQAVNLAVMAWTTTTSGKPAMAI